MSCYFLKNLSWKTKKVPKMAGMIRFINHSIVEAARMDNSALSGEEPENFRYIPMSTSDTDPLMPRLVKAIEGKTVITR
jgi:hypothetical protein